MNKITHNIILTLLAISTGALGLSILLMGHHRHITLTTDFFAISELVDKAIFNGLAGIAFLLISLLALITLKNDKFAKILGIITMLTSSIPLVSLLSSAMWIPSLGGFPAIGAGQGVIKYFALFAIGLYLFKPQLSADKLVWVNAFPVILVLLWIGGMKFTLLEAKGIEDLVSSSPLMSWMYTLWDLQMTSNLIGVYDIIALLLVIAAIFNHKLLLPAVVMSGAVFVVTQTFFLSWPAALSADTLLSSGGHFLIKDLWFIANLAIFTALIRQKAQS